MNDITSQGGPSHSNDNMINKWNTKYIIYIYLSSMHKSTKKRAKGEKKLVEKLNINNNSKNRDYYAERPNREEEEEKKEAQCR